ncbi:hypothetical protein ASPWEDRAFT_118810, partial [Aspergillus wentii DTO 134E9]
LVRGLASGIGLASEAVYHHKQKKGKNEKGDSDTIHTERAELFTPTQYDEHQAALSREVDEASWQLDEVQDSIRQADPPQYAEYDHQQPQLAETFLRNHPLPEAMPTEPPKLALPVIITQRRPGERARGFLRAYAPVLADVGIDQKTFLEFMDDLNKAVMPNGLIQAVNLAALAGHAAPAPAALAIAITLKIATEMADAAHSRYKTNGFLDRVNESFFAPRGLVALIMTWRPGQSGEMVTTVDVDKMEDSIASAANYNADENGSFQRFRHKFAQSSGATAFEWPETAPLVFPVLDDLAGDAEKEKKQNALKRSSNFVAEYMDRRGRAKWTGKNPDSEMANMAPKAEFHSRYSDPNHPASCGDPIALLTGGHLQGLGGLGGLRGGQLGRRGRERLPVGAATVIPMAKRLFEKVSSH